MEIYNSRGTVPVLCKLYRCNTGAVLVTSAATALHLLLLLQYICVLIHFVLKIFFPNVFFQNFYEAWIYLKNIYRQGFLVSSLNRERERERERERNVKFLMKTERSRRTNWNYIRNMITGSSFVVACTLQLWCNKLRSRLTCENNKTYVRR